MRKVTPLIIKCNSCKHYALHYIKTEKGFIPTAIGHCLSSDLNFVQSRKIYSQGLDCEFWIEQDEPIEAGQSEIDNVLHIISNQLNEIQIMLELYKKSDN